MKASVLGMACLFTFGLKATVVNAAHVQDGPNYYEDAVFILHPKTVLDASPVVRTKVRSALDCAFACLSELICLSFNVALYPDVNKLFECDALNASRFTTPEKLVPSDGFNHYSFLTPCEKNPCQNGGACLPDHSSSPGYRCECGGGYAGGLCQRKVRNCKDLLDVGATADGAYTIIPDERGPLRVYCDQTTDGGGWALLQRRVTPFNMSFNRNWEDYRIGFGDLTGEFWLGNDNIHRLAATPVSFRVDLHEGGNKLHAKYENFVVAGADDKYRWNMDSYSGTLANAIYGRYWHQPHVERGMQFSTPDQDNDGCPSCHCASSSGWWVNWCGLADLNQSQGPSWVQEVSSSNYIGASWSEMKVRPSSQ